MRPLQLLRQRLLNRVRLLQLRESHAVLRRPRPVRRMVRIDERIELALELEGQDKNNE